ncbi:lipoprotein 17-related variable surface protein [Mycoplasma sp. 48589B]
MSKVGKFLLVVVGGLAIGSAAVAVPSVIYKNQRDYQAQEAKLKQAQANVDVSLASTVNKAETLASAVTSNDVLFAGYDRASFDVSVVTLSADNSKGTLKVTYKIQSKSYAKLFANKETSFDGFKVEVVTPPAQTPEKAPIDTAAESIVEPVNSAYANIANNATYSLSDEQKEVITNYAKEVASGLQAESKKVLEAVKALPASQYQPVSALYNEVALKLNDVLVNALNNAIVTKAQDGMASVKEYIIPRMGEIKNNVADILIQKSQDIANVGQAIFETLRTNDSTKNLPTLDNFITGMTAYFKTAIETYAGKVKEVVFADGTKPTKALEELEKFLPELKAEAAAKAKEILGTDYDAVKTVLKSEYLALEQTIASNKSLLINETAKLAKVIDDLKLVKTEQGGGQPADGSNPSQGEPTNPSDEKPAPKAVDGEQPADGTKPGTGEQPVTGNPTPSDGEKPVEGSKPVDEKTPSQGGEQPGTENPAPSEGEPNTEVPADGQPVRN